MGLAARPVDCYLPECEILFHLDYWLTKEIMTLDTIPKKTLARVISVDLAANGALRLMEMGIVPGASLRVLKSAPLGDPLQVSLRSSNLALRREEARAIHVTLCEE